MDRIRHHLVTHADVFPDGHVEIRYSYPHSEPHGLREQLVKVDRHKIPRKERLSLDSLLQAIRARIPDPSPVRLPHREVTPTITPAILTVVIQDGRRRLPVARLYYIERLDEIGSGVEREVRLERGDFTSDERRHCTDVRQWIKGVAWRDFDERFK